MADTRYFVTRYGNGISGPGHRSLRRAMGILRRKAQETGTGPFHRITMPNHEMPLPELADQIAENMERHKVPHKEVVVSSKYDEPKWAIISQEVVPQKSPLVTALEPFVGKAGYLLGAGGPPGLCDCSGSTAFAADKAYGIYLPHSARDQGHMPEKFFYFNNTSELVSGDFIWYKYGGRVGDDRDDYDHVDVFVKPGMSIGSRPSTNGMGYYHWLNGADGDRPDWATRLYGRLRAA